jgi:NAD(P)-dependent dehydrogenase (short-subunit alcohol dehydrogenase family)
MTKTLSGRIALVTGASRGIGAEAAVALAKEGAHVVAVARTAGGLEELDDRIKAEGGTATLVPLDMKDTAGIARLSLALRERHGKLDILLGNAGILPVPSPVDHIEQKSWDDVLAINVTANWHLIRAFDPLLKLSDAGRAVFVTSALGSLAKAYFGAYAVSKAALDVLVRTYAAEATSTKLRVNLFSPGQTRTKMMAVAFPGVDPNSLPAPEQVAAAIIPLCRPDCSENGKVYDYRAGRFLAFQQPA